MQCPIIPIERKRKHRMTKPSQLLRPENLDFLLACFDTKDINKGRLYWKQRPPHHFKSPDRQTSWNKQFAGKITGRWVQGHRQIAITHPVLGQVLVLEHRLIWLLVHGEAPPPIIDHRNRIPFDNRPKNLRAATPGENLLNSIRSTGSNSRGAVSQTPSGTFHLLFEPFGESPWNLEFDSELAAVSAMNYLSWLYDTREQI